MKRDFLLILATALTLSLFRQPSFAPSAAPAQVLGVNYIWTDSISVNTTGIDSFFTVKWENLTIKADTGDVWVKAATGLDTANWSARDPYLLDDGESLSFGPSNSIRRLAVRANIGTSTVYFIGTKKRSMY